MRYFILLLFLLIPFETSASVIINEIAWMGSPPNPEETARQAANNEWIELYNSGQEDVDLTGWVLKAEDSSPTIKLKGVIPANGYFLLSRNNYMVGDKLADLVYPYKNNALSNQGEYLKLIDSTGKVVDVVDANDGWPAGDNETKQTMARIGSQWKNSQYPGGTPGRENSQNGNQNNHTTTLNFQVTSPTPKTNLQNKNIKSSDIPKVVFNEILPAPQGPDDENEWIEIANLESYPVDISGWQIEDSIGKTKIYIIPKNTIMPGYSFLVFSRSQTNIVLNNEGDQLLLKNKEGFIVDQINYSKAPSSLSYNRTKDNRWVWTENKTPGKENVVLKNISNTTQNNSQQNALNVKPKIYPTAKLLIPDLSLNPIVIAIILALTFSFMVIFLQKKLI